MKTNRINNEERTKAFKTIKKREVIKRQNLDVRYHVEDFEVNDRPRRFLEAFAAILKHSNYRMALDHYLRVISRCCFMCINLPGLSGNRRYRRYSMPQVRTFA